MGGYLLTNKLELKKISMKQKTQEKKLFTYGISTLALGIFPLFWFLSQAILFRELTDLVTRNVLVLIAIPLGSTFIFLLFLTSNNHALGPTNYSRRPQFAFWNVKILYRKIKVISKF